MERPFEVNPVLEKLLESMRTKEVALEFGNEAQIRALKYAERKSTYVEEVRKQAHDESRNEDDAVAEVIGDVYSVDMDIEADMTITVEVRALDREQAEELARDKFDNGDYEYDYESDGWDNVSVGHVHAKKKA
jgi:hypothetical protein